MRTSSNSRTIRPNALAIAAHYGTGWVAISVPGLYLKCAIGNRTITEQRTRQLENRCASSLRNPTSISL